MKSKIYFASDCHLGVPDKKSSFIREKRFVQWLDEIKADASELFLLGDIFDFWFEYTSVVPRGYVRLLGKFAELADAGVKIHYFTGNHDMWVFDYFKEELQMEIHKEPIVKEMNGKRFLIGHGDGLGPQDWGYKFIKVLFASKINQWLFARLHPNFAFKIAQFFSSRSRIANGNSDEIFLGEEKERLIKYCKEKIAQEPFDFFIFGHRHLPLDIQISETCRYVNLGEWIKSNSYAVFEDDKLILTYFKE